MHKYYDAHLGYYTLQYLLHLSVQICAIPPPPNISKTGLQSYNMYLRVNPIEHSAAYMHRLVLLEFICMTSFFQLNLNGDYSIQAVLLPIIIWFAGRMQEGHEASEHGGCLVICIAASVYMIVN